MEKHWTERAASKSTRVGDCVLFTGSLNKGYGLINYRGATHRVHRLSYEYFKGPIPEGLIIRHTCDTPNCWNPKHLLLGTSLDNARDRDVRCRRDAPKGQNNGNSILTDSQAKEILKLLSARVTQVEIARRFNIAQSTVSAIKVGRLRKESLLLST